MAVITVGAIDLGAESGRVARVDFDGTALSIGVVHRFGYEVKNRAGRLWWDWPLLAKNVVDGVGMLGFEASPGSVGVDAWGLDYALLDEERAMETRRGLSLILAPCSPQTRRLTSSTTVQPRALWVPSLRWLSVT